MGLQVRLRHALGERLFDLPDRPLENPLVIGRAREADIKIPSVTVSGQHGALFVHEGQWFVQDTSGGRSTWVNGNALEGPTPLYVGDQIIFGTDANPAMIEVDPAGVTEGRSGQPVVSMEWAPAAAPRATVAGAAPRQAMRAAPPAVPGGRAAPQPPPFAPVAVANDGWGEQADGQDTMAGWDQAAAPATEMKPHRRKKAQSGTSQGVLFGVIVFCVGVVGVTVYVIVEKLGSTAPAPVAQKVEAPKAVWGKSASSLFSEHAEGDPVSPNDNSTATPTPAPAPSTPANSTDTTSTPTPTPPDTTSDSPPKEEDKAYDELDAVVQTGDIGKALVRIDDYSKQHPGKHTVEIGNLIDDAMDRLWWKRIAGLCTRRDELNKQIAAKDKDIKDQPKGAFQETLKGEKKDLDAQLAPIVRALTQDMGYAGDAAPDPDNRDMISKLTLERDQGKFNDWKKQTHRSIIKNHGAMPWDG